MLAEKTAARQRVPAEGVGHLSSGGNFLQDARRQEEVFLRILTSGEPGLSVHPPYTTRVDSDTASRLLDLNREFYQTFAPAFASKRRRLQPGAARAVRSVTAAQSVLDLGCGHGLLTEVLAAARHAGRYVGLDSSQELLDRARRTVKHPGAVFYLADLADSAWPRRLASFGHQPFTWVFALAVLHHLPGEDMRLAVAAQARRWLHLEGRMVVSVWDFMASPRWKARILSWESIGALKTQVDPGDHLLDWREGGRGLRYVHHFTAESLEALAYSAGFRVEETFRSDGEGGRLGLYQVWQAA